MHYNHCNMKRNIKSFESDADVFRMIERASRDGIKLTHICNTAVREWLTKKGYARKKDVCEAKSFAQ